MSEKRKDGSEESKKRKESLLKSRVAFSCFDCACYQRSFESRFRKKKKREERGWERKIKEEEKNLIENSVDFIRRFGTLTLEASSRDSEKINENRDNGSEASERRNKS